MLPHFCTPLVLIVSIISLKRLTRHRRRKFYVIQKYLRTVTKYYERAQTRIDNYFTCKHRSADYRVCLDLQPPTSYNLLSNRRIYP